MKRRLDQLVHERGLAETRQRAQALIMAGLVLVDGRKVEKPGTRVSEDLPVDIVGPEHPYVGRGGAKLKGAVDRFQVEIDGRTCLDVGASTGGFTDCLLQHGATRVYSVDVGRGQLDWKLRNDPRVIPVEGCNARYLSREVISARLDLATVDVSFISLRMILPALGNLDLRGPILALVKPQFAVGRGEVGKGGIVRDAVQHRQVLVEMAEFCASIGLGVAGAMESPLTGARGNREFFLYLNCQTASCDSLERDIEEIFHGK